MVASSSAYMETVNFLKVLKKEDKNLDIFPNEQILLESFTNKPIYFIAFWLRNHTKVGFIQSDLLENHVWYKSLLIKSIWTHYTVIKTW